MTTEVIMHKFEKAGLGLAPFRCVGTRVSKFQATPDSPIQPGSSCDYCGAGIIYVFVVKSSDGKIFEVGCDCVEKTGDEGIINYTKREMNRLKTNARHADEDAKIATASEYLEIIRDRLSTLPHPNKYMSHLSLADWCDWIFKNAGRSGKMQVVRELKKI